MTVKDYANGFEKRARTRKVRRLCRFVRSEVGGDPETLAAVAERLEPQHWRELADAAGVTFPSPATRARVIHSLRTYRRRQHP